MSSQQANNWNATVKKSLIAFCDVVLAPFVLISAVILKLVRLLGLHRLELSSRVLSVVGLYPIRQHYYDPHFNYAGLLKPLDAIRPLPGLELNVEGQLALLREFHFNDELLAIPTEKQADHEYFYNCGWIEAGDAEFLYNMIRHFRPQRLVEVGAGYSTLLGRRAIGRNVEEDKSYRCQHTCIEPYENPWLEKLDVQVIREKVEDIEPGGFPSLGRNDILFIDSSHVIRPQGDVVFLILQLLPSLQPGVLIHLHDIFTPRDYHPAWIAKKGIFYNEQYLLEAFLSMNREFRVIGALNYLAHNHPDELAAACPVFGKQRREREPGSFWIVRV
jgi:hypothetical protein